jgi:hypothetical protein
MRCRLITPAARVRQTEENGVNEMRVRYQSTLVLVLGLLGAVCCLAQTPEPSAPDAASSNFEELPELRASEILQPEILKGPRHAVRESVPTFSGMNQFVIDSDYGVFDAEGNEMLLRRIKEVYAIDQLKSVSKTDQFEQSLMTAAKSPYNAAKNVVQDPVSSISNAGKGLVKFMGKVGQTAKHVAEGTAEKPTSESGKTGQDALGYTKTKKKLAISMGIDPYSTNQVLQKALDDVAWASWAGGFMFSAATFPISGPAGAALTATGVSSSIGEMLSEKSPAELKAMNRSALRSIGASAADADRFLDNTAFSPTAQTLFVQNLRSLGGVANRGAFVHTAAQKSSSEADAVFCVQTAALMGQLHHGENPLARIATIDDFPICIAKDGTVIAALQWDYAAWTPRAGAFTDAVKKLADEPGHNKHVLVAISGQSSPRLQRELQNRGIAVQDRINPGPLK